MPSYYPGRNDTSKLPTPEQLIDATHPLQTQPDRQMAPPGSKVAPLPKTMTTLTPAQKLNAQADQLGSYLGGLGRGAAAIIRGNQP
jgi:hypothetical protein